MPVDEDYKKPPLLESALEALYDIGCPIYCTEMAQYIKARWAHTYASLTSTRIERLMLSHIKKCGKGTSSLPPSSLCPTLTGIRGEPIMRLIARTDWSLEWRIIAATTGRLRHLRITARLCELALGDGRNFTDLSLLLRLTATLARGLPGVVIKHEQYELKVWRDLACGLIDVLSDEDERARINAAMKLLTVQNFNQFYGAPEEYLEEVSA